MAKYPSVFIFGASVYRQSIALLADFLREELKRNKKCHIITLNPEMAVRATEDDDFKHILKKADLVVADGIGIFLASRALFFLKRRESFIKKRITGSDIVFLLAQLIQERKKGAIFFYGGRESVAQKASLALKKKFPDLRIAGILPGYGLDENQAINKINESRANVLLVGLGSPKQEQFISKNLAKMPSVTIAVGVGGIFDFLSGKIKRAPRFFRKIGLEWLWRLLIQPWRIKRIWRAVIAFPLIFIRKELLWSKKQKEKFIL